MAAPSSSSCEVVDLGLAATSDDATSQIFFSKAGGDDLSWPAAAEIHSKLTKQESVVALCDKHGVPKEFKPVPASVLGCAAACETPPQGSNALCVYSDALEAGLRFPLHDFYLKLLRHYGLAPSQLVPNAWRYMAAFVLRCKEAGVEPLVSAFRYFFSVCAHKRKDKPLGWHHFTPCVGRPRLFSGTLPTRHGWKTRFFFLKSPEAMPWRCPVAWGKPRREDARTVELTDAAILKLKQMPYIDIKDFLSLHAPPVGALTLLQLHSPTAPMVKPESAGDSAQALTFPSLHATLEMAGARAPSSADAADEGDDMAWGVRRKRRCSGPGPASGAVTPPMPQSLAISAAPPLQGVEMTPSFEGAWGSNSEISPPAGISAMDALYMYDAMVAFDAENARLLQDNHPAAQEIAYLQDQLQQANAVNAKFMDYLVAARDENARLKEKLAVEIPKLNQERASEVAKLNQEHTEMIASEITKLNQEHASEVAKLQEEHRKAKAEHTAEIAKLQEEHAAEVAKLNQAHNAAVQDAKKDIVLALFPDLDASLL